MPARIPEFVLMVEETLAPLGLIERKRFFGGWSFAIDGGRFVYLLRGALYLSADEALRQALREEGCGPFRYLKGGREIVVEKFYEAPGACLDDPDALRDWAARAGRAVGAL